MIQPRCFTAALLLLALATATQAQDDAAKDKKLPPKESFHLYLLIGQSNMAGRGEVRDEDRKTDPDILVLTKDNTWDFAADPLHFDKPTIAGVGPGLSFGRRMKSFAVEPVTIGLIPCAVGGTPLERWEKEGDLYKAAVVRAKRAMKDGTLKGILWHQGESDAVQAPIAATYGMRLAEMIQQLRTDLEAPEVPFVCGKLGPFLPLERFPYAPVIDKALEEIPSKVENTACVDAQGLTAKPDRVHFNNVSARELGRRFAEAMRNVQNDKDR